MNNGNVLTQHNNEVRTGVILQPGIDWSIFAWWGREGRLAVHGAIYAQPLYVSQLAMADGKLHDVVFIATATNNLYAFDADTFLSLWSRTLGPYDAWEEDVYPNPDLGYSPVLLERTEEEPLPHHSNKVWDIDGKFRVKAKLGIGIQSTPVIDIGSNTMYVSYRIRHAMRYPQQFLQAIDIRTGDALREGECLATSPSGIPAPGFDLFNVRQRASLLLLNGVIYLAFASRDESRPYHGWILAFDARTLQQVGAFNTTPTGTQGGVWQASCGLAGDSQDGNIYFITGNGTFNPNELDLQRKNFGTSFVRIRPNITRRNDGSISRVDMEVVDYFTPFNQYELNRIDLDLGSAGAVLLPGTRRLIGGGKEGWMYLLDRDNMGKYDTDHDDVLFSFKAAENTYLPGDPDLNTRRPGPGVDWLKWPHIHGTPVYHHFTQGRAMLYVWPEKDYLKAFENIGNGFVLHSTTQNIVPPAPRNGMPGGMLSLAVNPNQHESGVLFASVPLTPNESTYVRGRLYAFDAITLERLWDNGSDYNGFEPAYVCAKFCPLTIANGRVFLPTFSNLVLVYGHTAPPGLWSEWVSLGGDARWPVVSRFVRSGGLEVFALGIDGALWHRWKTTPNDSWHDWQWLGGELDLGSGPALGFAQDGRLEIFARGQDGRLWHRWRTTVDGEWSRSWYQHEGQVTGPPAVNHAADGRLEVFARGNDGSLFHKWQISPNGQWHDWFSRGGQVEGKPAVGIAADSRLEVFVRDRVGKIQHLWQQSPNGPWTTQFYDRGGSIASSPLVSNAADGRLEVFAQGTDGLLNHLWQTSPNGVWTLAWYHHPGQIAGMPTVGKHRDGRLELFARGPDGRLMDKAQLAPNGRWDDWRLLGGQIEGPPTVELNGAGSLEVLVRQWNGQLALIWEPWGEPLNL